MGAAMLLDDTLRGNTLAQMRLFAGFFLLPEAVAGCVLLAYSARLSVDPGMLVLQRGKQRLDIAMKDIAAVTLWPLPTPGTGLTLHLTPAQAPTYQWWRPCGAGGSTAPG